MFLCGRHGVLGFVEQIFARAQHASVKILALVHDPNIRAESFLVGGQYFLQQTFEPVVGEAPRVVQVILERVACVKNAPLHSQQSEKNGEHCLKSVSL